MHGQGIHGAGGAGQASIEHDRTMCAHGILRGRDSRCRSSGA